MSENISNSDKADLHRSLPLLAGLGLSSEARVLLAAHACASKFARVGREELRILAAGLCQTTPVTKRAVEELIGSGLWADAPLKGVSGRPKVGYIGSARLRGLVDGKTSYPLGELVDHVLQPSNQLASIHASERVEIAPLSPVERKRQYRIQLRKKAAGATRWLLAVLLAHADRWGIVSGLGSTKLTELTGLNQERLKAHLFKLRELGFISHQLPGFSGWPLLSKWGTVYYLNLHHPDLRKAHAVSTIVVMDSRDKRNVRNRTEAGIIVGQAVVEPAAGFGLGLTERIFLGLPADAHDSENGLARYFVLQRPGGQVMVTAALQFVLDQLSSQLLSTRWHSLEQLEVDSELQQSVRGLLQVAKGHEVPMGEVEMMLAQVAVALACKVKRWLEPLHWLFLSDYDFDCDYQLLPVANVSVGSDGGVRCVLIRPRRRKPMPVIFAGRESAKQRYIKFELEKYPWKGSPLLSVPKSLARYGRSAPQSTHMASG